MKILLACSAGMSTSILEKNIQDYAKESNLKVEVIAIPVADAKRKFHEYEVVLLGPQVRYELAAFKELAGEKVPVAVIPPMDYAMGNGENIYNLAKSLIKK